MANNNHTMESVLAHHGIEGEGVSLIDNAREAGFIYACLGCGSVGTINPDTIAPFPTLRAAAAATRDAIEIDCCPDSDLITF
jgi:hypothetical protein